MAQLQLFTVTYEVPVHAQTKEDAEEKARMILAAGNIQKIAPQNIRVSLVGTSPRSL